MSRIVTVACHTCSHQWQVDLDQHQARRVIHKGAGDTRQEEYLLKCPRCGAMNIVEVVIRRRED